MNCCSDEHLVVSYIRYVVKTKVCKERTKPDDKTITTLLKLASFVY